MRTAQIIAGMAVVLMLLTWLWLRGTDVAAGAADQAMQALDDFSMAERALHRDVLGARIGMLRNYDPLVREIRAIRDAADRLRAAARREPEIAIAANLLTEQMDRQEEWTEQFKTRNALLQNSLSHFAVLSARLSAADQGGVLVRRVGALATAFLQLTFDSSMAAVAEVDDRLERISTNDVAPSDAALLEPLLAHARLLRNLLPATDVALKTVFSVPGNGETEEIRASILARKSAAESKARSFRQFLYATSVLLLGSLAFLAIQLQSRARMLRRRAAMEHVIAGISTRFINSWSRDIGAQVELALAELAVCMGAARAYFVLDDGSTQSYKWCRGGVSFAPDWPRPMLQLAERLTRKGEGVIQGHDVRRLGIGADTVAPLPAGLHAWRVISSRGEQRLNALLGFEITRASAARQPCELALLRMAFDAIANAVARESLERDRERLEANLRHARRMETVGALTSGIAHNFNNIIGAILGYVETAQAHLGSPSRSVESLQEIGRAAGRARDLIGQILTFGRGGALRSMRVCLEELVAEAKSLLDVSLSSHVSIVVRTSSAPTVVRGAPAHLQQVVLNVCKNAAQAMDAPGAIEIEIDIQELEHALQTNSGPIPPGRYAIVAVTDPGHGMEEAIQERMFEPFFTSRPEGNGLGLATVREIVLQHGGALKVRSAPGAGTRFEIWLPCAPRQTGIPDRESHRMSGRGTGETVLVLEADRERLLRHEEILAALGYEPVGFAHPAEALGALRAAPTRFDAALVCCHLHGLDSVLDFAATLHATFPGLPLILATASAGEFGAPSLAGAGVAAIIRQPLASGELADALAAVCYERPVQEVVGDVPDPWSHAGTVVS
jgi:signal transduction histidine kinase